MSEEITETPPAPELHEDPRDKEIDQLRVQLAGCGVAALGGTSPEQVAKQGDFGWSPAYQDVLHLRLKLEAHLEALAKTDKVLRVERAIRDIEDTFADLKVDKVDDDILDAMELVLERLHEHAQTLDDHRSTAVETALATLGHPLFNRPSVAAVVHRLRAPGKDLSTMCGGITGGPFLTSNWVDTTCKACLYFRPPIGTVTAEPPAG